MRGFRCLDHGWMFIANLKPPRALSDNGQRGDRLRNEWWAVRDLNPGPSRCKRDALTAELTARRSLAQFCHTSAKRAQ
jgi:hypothetical protein